MSISDALDDLKEVLKKSIYGRSSGGSDLASMLFGVDLNKDAKPETGFVEPVPGSVVYCDLAFHAAEHSGIYIGNGQIVALERDGSIVARAPTEFIKGTPALSIYGSCCGNRAVGSEEAAERARSKIGTRRNYNVMYDNCHHFSFGCLSGNFESHIVMLRQLKVASQIVLHADSWRKWNFRK